MTAPWEDFDCAAWTPADAEKALRWVLRAMYDTQIQLAGHRDAELAAKHIFERKKREAFFDEKCPTPARGVATVADREAFVERESAREREEYEIAQAYTAAASEHLRTLRDQSMVIAALSKTVGQVVGAGR
jgi:hypothetical protein